MLIPNTQTIRKVKSAMLCIQRLQWEQGCAAQAILEYEGVTDEVVQLCEAAAMRPLPDGRIGMTEKTIAVDDPAAIGEALILAAEKTKYEHLSKAADKLYRYLKFKAPRTEDGILYHFVGKWANSQIWVDAHYMAPPFLCKYGDADEAMKQIKGYRKYLYNEDKKLLSHIWDDKNKVFGREAFWGVGNGWAIAGMHRVYSMLGEDRKEDRNYLASYITELINGIIKYQREDGLFNDVLDDPSAFVETNVGQMLAYTIYRGVKAGYLDKAYLGYADKARAAAYNKVDDYGFVRGVCGMPRFDKPGSAAEGQAFFILMEAAARDLYEEDICISRT